MTFLRIVVVVFLALTATAAGAAEQVAVRGGIHKGFARIVFDWRKVGPYEVRLHRDRLIVSFENSGDFDLQGLSKALAGYIGEPAIATDGSWVSFPLRDAYKFKHSSAGGKVIVDLLGEPVNTAQSRGGKQSAWVSDDLKAAQQTGAGAQSKNENEAASKQETPASAAATVEDPVLKLRAGQHPGFSRLVFDWTTSVGYRLEQAQNQAIIYFDRRVKLDLARYRANPLPNIKTIEARPDDQGLKVAIMIPSRAKIRLFKSGNKIVLDVLTPDAQKTASIPKPAKAKPKKTVPAVVEPKDSEAAPEKEWAAGDSKTAADATTAAEVKAPTSLLPEGSNKNQLKSLQTAAAKTATPLAKAPQQNDGKSSQVDVAQRLAKADEATLSVQFASGGQGNPADLVSVYKAMPNAEKSTSTDKASSDDQGIELKFVWKSPVPTAMFQRGENLWLVFDDASAENLAQRIVRDAPELAPAEQFQADGATILRLSMPPGLSLTSRLEESTWIIGLKPQSLSPEIDVVIEVNGSGRAAQVLIPVGGARRIVSFIDPDMGDNVIVAPIMTQGQGLATTHEFPQFRVLASHQGVVLQPMAEDIQVAAVPRGVVVNGRNGLLISSNLYRTLPGRVEEPTPRGRRLFDLESWRRGDSESFTKEKQALQLAIAMAQGLDADLARLDLARFYFSHGLTAEALTEIVLVESKNARLVEDPQIILLRGASEILRDGQAAAVKMLSHPALNNEWEATLWQAVLATQGMNWPKAAEEFLKSEELIADYARTIRVRLRLLAAESQLEVTAAGDLAFYVAQNDKSKTKNVMKSNDLLEDQRIRLGEDTSDTATDGKAAAGVPETEKGKTADQADAGPPVTDLARYLQQIRDDSPTEAEQAQVDYIEAYRLLRNNKLKEALALWQGVTKSTHHPSAARARLALLEVGMIKGTVTDEQAIEELERLRFAWRGGQFEFALLQRLGEFYAKRKDYRRGLDAWRQAASYFPDSEQSRAVTQRMRKVFADLYVGDGAAEMTPLTALSLYDEFKELTPVGAPGNVVIAKLADRLVQVDLLGRAASLLKDQVLYRLTGVERARVGARLALIELLDQQPGKALDGLNMSVSIKIPEDLKRQRMHLRARAMAELGQESKALNLLANDDSADARRLRIDILWQKQNWPAVSVELAQIIPNDPPVQRPLTDSESQFIVNLAISLSLSGNRAGLNDLGERYGSAMAASSQKEIFALLAGRPEEGGVQSIAKELAQVGNVQAFMTSYRERLQGAQLSTLN